ncbi:MAG: hypothetical protein IIA67_04595 [Planctomycetes bacterium]|nr:hypothetical protein [Planctomycetota bacterium]
MADVEALAKSFEETQFGRLLADPVMKPFAEDLKSQLRDRLSITKEKLGITWDDVQGVVAGELTVAVVQPAPKPIKDAGKNPVSAQAVFVIMADVTGRADKARALLAKIDADLLKRGAKKKQPTIAGVPMTVYELPKKKGTVTQHRAIFFIKNDLLVACDDVKVIGGIARRLIEPAEVSSTLAGLPAYQMINKRCRAAAGDLAPQVRWFLEPFGYIAAMQSAANDGKAKRGKKMLSILQAQGFDAIQGLGGFVNLAEDRYDLLHRTFIYAPGEGGKKGPAKSRLRLAARMLTFPNSDNLEPQAFVPRDVASYGSLNFDIKGAFDTVGTLVDAVIGEPGIWDEIIDGLKNDPDGPMVDVEKNIVGQLSNRITVMTANKEPIGLDSERLVIIIDVKNMAVLAKAVEKMMKGNEAVKKRTYKGRVIWEVTPEEEELPTVEISGPGAGLLNVEDDVDDDEDDEEDDGGLGALGVGDHSAITVTDGHLIIASHLDILKRILDGSAPADRLAAALDYQLVNTRLQALTAGRQSVKFFSRTDEEYRVNYEMLRRGKMPEAKTVMGAVLNALLGEGGRKKTVRKAKIDGKKLPSYDVVRRYLGPAGLAITTEQDGWFITGFTLDKRKAELTSRVKPLKAAAK